QFLSHRCYVFFVLPPGDIFTTKITNPFQRLNRKKFERFDDQINHFTNTVDQIATFLGNGKINSGKAFSIRPLTAEEMFEHYDYYFNNFQYDFVTDRELKGGYMQIGDRMLGAICTRDEESMPHKFSALHADREFTTAKYKFFQNIGDLFSFGLDFDHVYNQIIYFEDNQQQLAKLRKRHDLLKKSASFDPNNKTNAEKLDVLIESIAHDIDSERIIRGHFNILFLADSESEIRRCRNAVIERFRNIDVKPGNLLETF